MEGNAAVGRTQAVVYNQRRLPPSEAQEETMSDILRRSEFLTHEEDGERRPLLSEEATVDLARHCRLVRYTRGEILARQGEKGDACWVVSRGVIHGTIEYREDGQIQKMSFPTTPLR